MDYSRNQSCAVPGPPNSADNRKFTVLVFCGNTEPGLPIITGKFLVHHCCVQC